MEAIVTDTLINEQLYLWLSSQNRVFLNSNKNIFLFLHSPERPASVMDTFFAFQGCPLTRASFVYQCKSFD